MLLRGDQPLAACAIAAPVVCLLSSLYGSCGLLALHMLARAPVAVLSCCSNALWLCLPPICRCELPARMAFHPSIRQIQQPLAVRMHSSKQALV